MFVNVFLLYAWVFPMKAEAYTMSQSPYVSFSPDGSAWTVKEELPYTNQYSTYWESKEYPEYWYKEGTTYATGIVSSIRSLKMGEHYYAWNRYGEVPVGKWVVEHQDGKCIHESDAGDIHGYTNVEEKCYCAYYSGWYAYCADCGEPIRPILMYMSSDAVQTIKSINTYYGYYYVCPTNGHVENDAKAAAHVCKDISYNCYRVKYRANDGGVGDVSGKMMDSYHMYNNSNIYEGKEVTPQTSLSLNSYSRVGYVFVGWNTKADGSGVFYEDGAEIVNLSDYDYRQDSLNGTVTLYAQWERAESTLHIDPNGGTYDGSSSVTTITQDYGTTYYADPQLLTAPDGYTVTFETNGGSAVNPIIGKMYFNSWILSNPLNGKYRNDIYAFLGGDGTEDTLTAYYEPDEVELPITTKTGWSFGGWYYDAEFTLPAGAAGDTIVPNRDIVLYAQWVDLQLQSTDNYTVNDGKGAVDLTWTQSDRNNKTYLIYQSLDGKEWTKVNSANDISDEHSVNVPYAYSGKTQTYTVPYTGLYTLTAYGAQGEGYNERKGGLGGGVTAKVWLYQGEVLTINVGGIDGYNGGGDGWMYGNGGGATTVVSDRRGTLLVAAGGGGATVLADGGAGGLVTGLRADGQAEGAYGGAGGGAGYVGGNAGEAIVHNCTDACYKNVDVDILTAYSGYKSVYEYTYQREDGNDQKVQELRYGQKGKYIPVNGGTSLHLEVMQRLQMLSGSNGNDPSDSYIAVYDQNENLIYQRCGYYNYSDYFVRADMRGEFDDEGDWYHRDTVYSWGTIEHWNHPLYRVVIDVDGNVNSSTNNFDTYYDAGDMASVATAAAYFRGTTCFLSGTAWYGGHGTYFYEDITIPSGTTGIRIVSSVEYNVIWNNDYMVATLDGGRDKICGFEDGQLISYNPAYGGSNYVNTQCSNSYKMESGVRQGNGSLMIESVKIGFMDELELTGVEAPDLAAPDKAAEKDAFIEETGENLVKASWDTPKDNGTKYYHKVESYLVGSDNLLCESNKVRNTLTSGTWGYYYRVDSLSIGDVTTTDSKIETKGDGAYVEFALGNTIQYVHVAAYDKAGNLSETAHIKVDPNDIAWNLSTEPITITDVMNGTDYGTVYPKGDGSFYVRADGNTPFRLAFDSKMNGVARENYQMDYQIFDVRIAGAESGQRVITRLPYSTLEQDTVTLSPTRFLHKTEGDSLLTNAMYTGATRSAYGRVQSFYQAFSIPQALHGQTFVVTPIVGATYGQSVKYSSWEDDSLHAILLIADGEAPCITGAELLESLTEIDRNTQDIYLNLYATDDLSGVEQFKVVIYNNDSRETKEYVPDENGQIAIHLTAEESVLYGDLSITLLATDHVGNERKEMYRITEFALETWVERILPPHEPVFQRGESGILYITTWGYADRVEVEFPAAILEQNPDLQTVYDYTERMHYCQKEGLQFMIPLEGTASEEYTITVRAFKDGQELADYPSIRVVAVEGTVLDEFRTRLR